MKIELDIPDKSIAATITLLMNDGFFDLSFGVITLNTEDLKKGYKDCRGIIKEQDK